MSELSYQELFYQVIVSLPQRSQDILAHRFAVVEGAHTLDGIGKMYGLTRERIRQIIDQSVTSIRENLTDDDVATIYAQIEDVIKQRGGIMPEDELVAQFSGDDSAEAGAIRFFLELSTTINRLKRKDVTRTVVHVEFDEEQWERVKDVVRAILMDVREPLAQEILHEQYLKHEDADPSIDSAKLASYLEPVNAIQRNPFGRWGMANWRDVRPRGVKEKIYLVLKERGEPLHFAQIAKDIDYYKLNKRPGGKTNVQTVHNELIKDPRFMLVGRGLYALKGWGYAAGTVRDVITEILRKNNGKAMTTREIINEVLKVRDVREMTVAVNLNSFFKKVGRGLYTLPE